MCVDGAAAATARPASASSATQGGESRTSNRAAFLVPLHPRRSLLFF